MAKKSDIKPLKTSKKRMTAGEREELLIENFVGIQTAMTNLSIKFEKLSDHIAKLLQVFEQAARGFVSGSSAKGDKEMLNKIDSLLNQNKTIAKGLVLMEEKLRNRTTQPFETRRPKPLPRI